MGSTDQLDPLLLTKLQSPRLGTDHVRRDKILDTLRDARDRDVILVCAPAGYGKSTLVADWLRDAEDPVAWVSLEETEYDLRSFLRYFLSAIQAEAAGFGEDLVQVLDALELPPVDHLAKLITNELLALDQKLTVVLDDYHLIGSGKVDKLVDRLLVHPAPTLLLVIVTRHNPSLALASLRANNKLQEIRMSQLQFDLEDASRFLSNAVDTGLSEQAIKQIHLSTEGWAVGLRLAALALRQHLDVGDSLGQFDGNTWELQQYLMGEVLQSMPESERLCLYRLSILERFDAELVEFTASGVKEVPTIEIDGRSFLNKLLDSGFFCISLDKRRKWSRFHPLFKSLLLEQLEEHASQASIKALQASIGHWLEDRGQISSALRHYQSAKDYEAAKTCLVRHHDKAFEREQIYLIMDWLEILGDLAKKDPELLLMQAWISERTTRFEEVLPLISKVEAVLESGTGTPKDHRRSIAGECEALRSVMDYWVAQPDDSLFHANKALEMLPDGHWCRGYTAMLKMAALQMTGNLSGAMSAGSELLGATDFQSGAQRGRLLQIFCYLHWLSGNLSSLRESADALLNFAADNDLGESALYAHYFNALANYQANDVSSTIKQLETYREGGKFINYQPHTAVICLLANAVLASGEPTAARGILESNIQESVSSGAVASLNMAQAAMADLAFRQGDIAEAASWARKQDCSRPNAAFLSIMPELVALKIRTHPDLADIVGDPVAEIEAIIDFLTRTHNTPFLIQTLGIKALHRDAIGDRDGALDTLARGVDLGRSSGAVRLLADLGPGLVPLFNQLQLDTAALEYVGRVIAGIGAVDLSQTQGMHPSVDRGLNSLSRREQEILELLAQRLGNAEIGEKLFISTSTVKRHAHNIYEKLGVHSRREAVAKAIGLGVITAK